MWRRKTWILGPTLAIALAATVGVNLLTPQYKSEARILFDGRENIFLRPEAEKSNLDRAAADQETLTSQVQLVLSRQLALEVVKNLRLNERAEFDPVLRGISPLNYVLVLAGVARDPMRMTAEERVLRAYFERLTAYPVEKSRVIAVEFQSSDPELAARVVNAIADGYLALQQSAKQEQTRAAGQWLSGEIDGLRRKVADAEARAEEFRANLDVIKGQAASTNGQDVQLRALEREAKAQRDLLESYLVKYCEATARESIGKAPADARVISRAVVSNTPYFPKKFPMVLVATLATMVLSAGFVTFGELLRNAPVAGPSPAMIARRLDAPTHPTLGVGIDAIDEVARSLRGAGEGGRRIVAFGASRQIDATLATITMARALARDAKTVLVDLALGMPNLPVISSDPGAPGIADAVRANASFGEIITRDTLSRLHLIAAGRCHTEGAEIVASQRLTMMIEALARCYEHVVIFAGAVPDAAVERMFRLAPRAVLVTSDRKGTAGKAARTRLADCGFTDIATLVGAPLTDVRTPRQAAA